MRLLWAIQIRHQRERNNEFTWSEITLNVFWIYLVIDDWLERWFLGHRFHSFWLVALVYLHLHFHRLPSEYSHYYSTAFHSPFVTQTIIILLILRNFCLSFPFKNPLILSLTWVTCISFFTTSFPSIWSNTVRRNESLIMDNRSLSLCHISTRDSSIAIIDTYKYNNHKRSERNVVLSCYFPNDLWQAYNSIITK